MSEPDPPDPKKDFEQLAAEKPPGFLADMFDYLREHKKWWLLPLLVTLLLLGAFLVFSGTVAAPFIYTLF